ncbi:hypothetical protein REPUB_Repub11eG0102500 [Reevesia pubescens]
MQGRWLMHEYSLFSDEESHGYVLCEIRNAKPIIVDQQQLAENVDQQEICSSRGHQQVEYINSVATSNSEQVQEIINPADDHDETQKYLNKRNLETQEVAPQPKRMCFSNDVATTTTTSSSSFTIATHPNLESTSSIISHSQGYTDVELCVGAESTIMMSCDNLPSASCTTLCKENQEEISKPEKEAAGDGLDIETEEDHQDWLSLLDLEHDSEHQDIGKEISGDNYQSGESISQANKELTLEDDDLRPMNQMDDDWLNRMDQHGEDSYIWQNGLDFTEEPEIFKIEHILPMVTN